MNEEFCIKCQKKKKVIGDFCNDCFFYENFPSLKNKGIKKFEKLGEIEGIVKSDGVWNRDEFDYSLFLSEDILKNCLDKVKLKQTLEMTFGWRDSDWKRLLKAHKN